MRERILRRFLGALYETDYLLHRAIELTLNALDHLRSRRS